MNKSHLTAITRKGPSVPMKWLAKRDRLSGRRTLDYGCGRGTDAKHFGMDMYDLYHYPVWPLVDYDVITCNYVLNVIPNATERLNVLHTIQRLLSTDGVAYVTVRTDKAELNGWTSRGTWQGLIRITGASVLRSVSAYTIYEIRKDDVLGTFSETDA
jgi:2-polyprenyl-3-methyl-5-hydroxy-6-metoxy-1,4-benzoquinol methylase